MGVFGHLESHWPDSSEQTDSFKKNSRKSLAFENKYTGVGVSHISLLTTSNSETSYCGTSLDLFVFIYESAKQTCNSVFGINAKKKYRKTHAHALS